MKGKWKIVHEFNVADETGRVIATCGGYSSNLPGNRVHEENIENARAIAALPELIEALRGLIALYDSMCPKYMSSDALAEFKAIMAARKALTKAGVSND